MTEVMDRPTGDLIPLAEPISKGDEMQLELWKDEMAAAPFRPELYSVRPIDFKQARKLIEYGHYTHSLTKGRHSFGMFFGDRLVGASVFGQPSGRMVAASLWDHGNERNTLELLRLYILDVTGKNAESWFMSRSLRLLPPEVALVVAYSSPGAGHYGACYQAANWLYVGRSQSGQNYFYVDARGVYVNKRIPWQYGPRSGRPHISEKEAAAILGLTRIDEGRKYTYVYPLVKKLTLKRKVLPYPKPGEMSSSLAVSLSRTLEPEFIRDGVRDDQVVK